MSNQTTSKHTRNNAKRIPSAIRDYAEKNWGLKATIVIGVITAFFPFGCQEKTSNMSGNVNGEARAAKVEKKEVKNPAAEIFDGKKMSGEGQGQLTIKKPETKPEQTLAKPDIREAKKTKPNLKKVVPEKIELKGLPPRGPGPGGSGEDPKLEPIKIEVKGRS